MSASSRLDSLDTLRGVAILSVIAFHVGGPIDKPQWLTALLGLGNLGVQLFFLISAWTMCHMWQQRRCEPQPTLRFYVRRGFRIAPAFWVAMLFYNGVHVWQTGDLGPVSGLDLLLTALFLHGFSFHAINLAVPGGWSIAVEMSFYAVFPWIVDRLRTVRSRLLAGLGCYVVGVAASMALGRWADGDISLFLYYSLLTQAPIFLLGMALHAGLQAPRAVPWPLVAGVAVVWLLLAFGGKALGWPTRPFFWLPVFVLMAVMALVIRRGLHWAPLVQLGRWSYSLYLFHFAVVDFLLRPLAAQLPGGVPGYLLALALCLGLSALIAWASARTLEAWSTDAARRGLRWWDARRARAVAA